jgi:hypothetical protein
MFIQKGSIFIDVKEGMKLEKGLWNQLEDRRSAENGPVYPISAFLVSMCL